VRFLGMLEHFLGRRGAASEYFETALEVNARTGHELERWRSALGFAHLLAEGKRSGERERALQLLDEVSESAAVSGARWLHAQARKLALRLNDSRAGRPRKSPRRAARA
jgi:hypothetical protein